jgi:Ca-activated chloride channel family protein
MLAPVMAALPQESTFRTATHSVWVYATVTSESGRLVPPLAKEDFAILDDGEPQEITLFRREQVPISVVVMFDTSGSSYRRLQSMRGAGHAFVGALLPFDRARIGSFGKEIAISPRLTGDHKYLMRVVDRELWIDGATPLWRAIDAAMSSLAGESGRRVVLVVSDGIDTTGGRSVAVAQRARREGFSVYAVGFVGEGLAELGPVRPPGAGGSAYELRNLALDTGGVFVAPRDDAELASGMRAIADDLHSQYALAFSPRVLDGRTHRLQLIVKAPGYRVRSRQSYVAESGKR